MIGRSFSDDGGGGHNPIEAAQLDCAIVSTMLNITPAFDLLLANDAAALMKKLSWLKSWAIFCDAKARDARLTMRSAP